MAVGLGPQSSQAVDEEARAEVDVLNSRLEKTTQLTKKIQASLGRLEVSGKSVADVASPLNGETRRLQVLGNSTSRRSCLMEAPVDSSQQISTPSLAQSTVYDSLLTARTMRRPSFAPGPTRLACRTTSPQSSV